jgi:hypothetical protein
MLLQSTMEESIGHIQLPSWPLAGGSDGENRSYGGRLDDGREGFAEVNPGALREPSNDPAGLVAIKGTIGAKFMCEDPLA